MVHIPEKLEECPHCGADSPAWAYDFQNCSSCGFGAIPIEKGPTMTKSEIVKKLENFCAQLVDRRDLAQKWLNHDEVAAYSFVIGRLRDLTGDLGDENGTKSKMA